MPDEDMYFVGIEDPVEMRRYILETARESIRTLQMFEKFRSLRDEKMKAILSLKSSVREINRLLSKVKTALPQANLRIKLHEHDLLGEKPLSRPKKQAKGSDIIKSAKGDLEKLESELSAIENKLNSLS